MQLKRLVLRFEHNETKDSSAKRNIKTRGIQRSPKTQRPRRHTVDMRHKRKTNTSKYNGMPHLAAREHSKTLHNATLTPPFLSPLAPPPPTYPSFPLLPLPPSPSLECSSSVPRKVGYFMTSCRQIVLKGLCEGRGGGRGGLYVCGG